MKQKNGALTMRAIVIVALMAAIGFTMAACSDGSGKTGVAPAITTSELPGGTVNAAYTQTTLEATGDAPIAWSIVGNLPADLTLAADTGVISGTPRAAGTFNFTVKATNAAGEDTKALSIVVAPSSGGDFVPVSNIAGIPETGTAGTPLTLDGTVEPPNATYMAIVWSVVSGPAEVSDNTLTFSGTGDVVVKATIANGMTRDTEYTQEFTITVSAGGTAFVAVTNIAGIPEMGTAGTPLTLDGTVEPSTATNETIVWSKVSGPADLSGNTLTFTGTGTVVVKATIANGTAEGTDYTQEFSITVSAGGFVAVTNITGIPETATAATPLTLNGTVEPSTATNKTIVWSKVSGPADLSGSTLTFTGTGTVVVKATIANGTAQGTDYTQDFTIMVPVTTSAEWTAALTQIGTSGNHTITINGNIGLEGKTTVTSWTFGTTASGSSLTVTLKGSGKLYLTGQGRLFLIGARQTLIIDSETLTLEGLKDGQNDATQDNNAVVVHVIGGNMELKNGTISGNTYAGNSGSGGAVYVQNGGTFTMSGGEISGNHGPDGGCVYVASSYSDNPSTFTMNGGEISGNSARSSGGGVFINGNGTFTMNTGARISGNQADGSGGGVYMANAANVTFTMNGGKISDNEANSGSSSGGNGGGVYVVGNSNSPSIFTMNGGEISGNKAISIPTSSGNGGGVYIGNYANAIFRIVNGTIYGSDATVEASRNTSSGNGGGAALFKSASGVAERGTFSDATWTSSGDLVTTNDTISVVGGVSQ